MIANQVTLARIAALPIPCAMLLFGDACWYWVAFFLFVFLGMTDFIDGMMARREGPTKLGSLLDPVADKIMIAAVTFALAVKGWVPVWIPVAILSREFLVTVLRSSVSLRKAEVKTTILAKLKTIIQMGGFGNVFLTVFLPTAYAQVVALFWALFFFAIWVVYRVFLKRNAPHWAAPVGFCFVYWYGLLQFLLTDQVCAGLCYVIVAITWVSAIDYLKTSFALIRSTGMFRFDWIRLFWVLSHSILAVWVGSVDFYLTIPVLIAVSFELATGGIDNIAISDGTVLSNRIFWPSSIVALALALYPQEPLAYVLAVLSLGMCLTAYRGVLWRFFPGR
ncbi:MAG: CDP-alcohol phosphatidyltransferase family protein [Myxococcaceae bacterium]|nr:CDP-alcohol phosphatidyltransferase family protein [Myxococcaceae bacterium]MBH2006623.1 CDP-alcohol phosphatidyltransferase family protein [Myxococcaceae bacterium]